MLAGRPVQVGHELVELVQVGLPHLGDLTRSGHDRAGVIDG
jgi:hypothetical protein